MTEPSESVGIMDIREGTSTTQAPPVPGGRAVMWKRFQVAAYLLLHLRRHDFRAAGSWMRLRAAGHVWPVRLWMFLCWALRQMVGAFPDVLRNVTWARPVSRTPFWMSDGNQWANHPWGKEPGASLPARADVVVVGAGFTGGGLAYHWSKLAPHNRTMVVLEMDDPASGASGRNEGVVVMGRYYGLVFKTVRRHADTVRPDLSPEDRDRLAHQFATAYVKAAYKNGDLIEQTVAAEGFDCDYARNGWVQAIDPDLQEWLAESVRMGRERGFTDWTAVAPDEALQLSGIRVTHDAALSRGAATFQPAKWVWSLFDAALAKPHVELFTRTKVTRIEDAGPFYRIHTTRGPLEAVHVVNATESYTPTLHRNMHGLIRAIQTQAAYVGGGPPGMKASVGVSGPLAFWGRHGDGVLAGSDATRVPDRLAGQNKPSRFLTVFFLSEMERYFGPSRGHVTHEWSGTVGFTPDEYPIVGLLDNKRQYVIAGMCGSGTGVSFDAARCICGRILGNGGADDYPPEYFAPARLLSPATHVWPVLREEEVR